MTRPVTDRAGRLCAVTSLGTTRVERSLAYGAPNGRTYATRFPITAALKWQAENGADITRVDVIASRAALEANLTLLVEDLQAAALKAEVTPHQVAEAGDQNAMVESHRGALAACRFLSGDRVLLDVTNGLRHQPMLLLLLLADLAAQDELAVEAITYGFLDGPPAAATGGAILDLVGYLELPRWTRIARDFERTGSAAGLVDAMREIGRRLPGRLEPLARNLQLLGAGLSSGLAVAALSVEFTPPKEADWAVLRREMPWAEQPVRRATDVLSKLALGPRLAKAPFRVADQEVVEALATFVDLAFKRTDLGSALGAIQELAITRSLLAAGGDDADGNWLRSPHRKHHSVALTRAILRRKRQGWSADECTLLGDLAWLRDKRNKYAHAGFTLEEVLPQLALEEAVPRWQRVRASLLDDGFWKKVAALTTATAPDLVVTPIGLGAGVLYTLLHRIHAAGHAPPRVVVIASPESADGVGHAARKLAEESVPVGDRVVVLTDPHDWRAAIEGAGWDQAREWARASSTTWVNLTGGTTRLTHVAQRVGRETWEAGAPVVEVALVDRRPQQEQRDDPFVLGELIEIAEGSPGAVDEQP